MIGSIPSVCLPFLPAPDSPTLFAVPDSALSTLGIAAVAAFGRGDSLEANKVNALGTPGDGAGVGRDEDEDEEEAEDEDEDEERDDDKVGGRDGFTEETPVMR